MCTQMINFCAKCGSWNDDIFFACDTNFVRLNEFSSLKNFHHRKKAQEAFSRFFCSAFFGPDQFPNVRDLTAAKSQNTGRRSSYTCMWGIIVISSVAELGLLAVLLALPGTPSAARLVCPSFSPAVSSKQFSAAMFAASKRACSARGMCSD